MEKSIFFIGIAILGSLTHLPKGNSFYTQWLQKFLHTGKSKDGTECSPYPPHFVNSDVGPHIYFYTNNSIYDYFVTLATALLVPSEGMFPSLRSGGRAHSRTSILVHILLSFSIKRHHRESHRFYLYLQGSQSTQNRSFLSATALFVSVFPIYTR